MSKLTAIYDRSRVPLYLQVASVMRQRIQKGYWKEGQKISTLEELEAEFSVARVTIRQAVEILRDEGLLESLQGRGTFVSNRPKNSRSFDLITDFDSVLDSLQSNVVKRVEVKEHRPAPLLAPDEGTPAEDYTLLRSVQYNEGAPFSVVNLFLDTQIFERDPEQFKRVAALPVIMDMDDIVIAHAYQTLTIGVSDPETADLLKIGLGEPTVDCHLVLIDDKGTAIYNANIHYIKDCVRFRTDLLGNTGPRRGGRSKKSK
ncbi:GntR family transcriptional regulator [Methyloligella sp. 2.7D]|uniref:GntR family transcriptional regulator n=1 Tax=unclassified Methyloligella TaxID=2625955 RepID=UPI00157D94AC|nr:GntR family transcriptional regulator [Methyloligella sp. GL2]QKP78225.1 GntR family transcriptional regulator [Methyloligella sp. GL2]